MSLPSFPDKDQIPTREEVINQIISSIAMEELGLSHIINAEGEKLQYALGTITGITGPDEPLTMEELLKINNSIHKTLDSTMMNQFFLKEKLIGALSSSVMQGPTGPTGPQGPATIEIDPTVENLNPGEAPYVNNDQGTPENVILKFGIPRGATGAQGSQGPQGIQGPQGPQGVQGTPGTPGDEGPTGPQGIQGIQGPQGESAVSGIRMMGSYDPDEVYLMNDLVVSAEGDAFVARIDNPTGPPPDDFVSNDEWAVFVARGAKGEQGIQGIQGITGPAGAPGEQGPQGIQGEQGPEGPQGIQGPPLAQGEQLFAISGTTGTGTVGFGESLTVESETLEVTTGPGAKIKIEKPYSVGTVIHFNSGNSNTLTTSSSGMRSRVLIVGHGGTQDVNFSFNDPIDITSLYEYAFPMPADGVISSLSFFYTLSAPTGAIGNFDTEVRAALYISNNPPNNSFYAIPETMTVVKVPNTNPSGSVYSAITENINVEVHAQDRLMLAVYSNTAPEYAATTTITGYLSAAVRII